MNQFIYFLFFGKQIHFKWRGNARVEGHVNAKAAGSCQFMYMYDLYMSFKMKCEQNFNKI